MSLAYLYLEKYRIERELKNLNLFSLYTEKALLKELQLLNKRIKKTEKGGK